MQFAEARPGPARDWRTTERCRNASYIYTCAYRFMRRTVCGMDCPGREGRVRPASYELRAARYHRPRESQECRRAGEEISAQGESRCAHSCGRGQPCSLHAGPRKQSSLFHRAQSRNTAVAAINAAHGQLRGERREESACVPRDTAHAHSRNALCVGTTPLAGHRYHKEPARARVSRQGVFRTDTKR